MPQQKPLFVSARIEGATEIPPAHHKTIEEAVRKALHHQNLGLEKDHISNVHIKLCTDKPGCDQ
jgi:hypothetical protein